MRELPWISCVCVSQNRPAFLKKAIGYFNAQTYTNKDLVIVYEGDDTPFRDLSFRNEKITVFKLTEGSSLSLGERRNISIQHAKGEYVCQWDDDDWFHNDRLEIQMRSLLNSKKPANILNRLVLYNALKQQAYLSSERFWEGSLLCKTDLFKEYFQYPKLNKGEDNDLVVKLVKQDYVGSLFAPYLYTYLFHGANTWDAIHFQHLFNAGYRLDPISDLLIKKIIDGEYDPDEASEKMKTLRFDVPGLRFEVVENSQRKDLPK